MTNPTHARLYRCYLCGGHEFMAATGADPVCPSCGTSQRDPRAGGMIATLEVIHFDPPATVKGGARALAPNTRGARLLAGFGLGHAACNPAEKVSGGGRFTGEPLAVTCPACKASDAFKAHGLGAINPRFDLPAEVDAGGGVRLVGLPAGGEADAADAADAVRDLRRGRDTREG